MIAETEIEINKLIVGRDEENGLWYNVNFEGEECGKFRITVKYGQPPEPAVPVYETPATPAQPM